MSGKHLQHHSIACFLLSRILLLLIIPLLHLPAASAHELRPAILDIGVVAATPDQMTINLTFSGEAFLADIDLSAISDTDDSKNSEIYDTLRAIPPTSLADRVEGSFVELAERLAVVSAGRPLLLEVVSVEVVDEPDLNLARDTRLKIRSDLPPAGEPVSVRWHSSLGALLIRQTGTGSDPAYSDYLPNGGVSQEFALSNAQPTAPAAIIGKYLWSGIIHIVPAGLDHILFVVGLLAYGMYARGLIFQISLFTAAHTMTLAAASFGWLSIPATIVEPLIALSIAWIGVENIIKRSAQVTTARSVVVFAFGLLHGLGFASVLSDFGLPQGAFLVGLLSFNLGVEVGQLMIVIPIFCMLLALRLTDRQFRQIFQIPVSAIISAIGAFWFLERTGIV